MENFKAVIMDEAAVMRAVKRISHEIVERNNGCENLYIVGIKRRGAPLAKMIAENIGQIENCVVPTDTIDITFYRDDTERHITDPIIKDSQLSFDVCGKRIVLVDDVLYTGRTVRAAMEAIMNHGRPSSIQLAVLVDRGHRELPIRGDYVGKNVPTSKSERIVVKIPPIDKEVAVTLYD